MPLWGSPSSTETGAAIEYWAILSADGEEETLAGIALLRFDGGGLVVEQRDYWSMQPGRTPARF